MRPPQSILRSTVTLLLLGSTPQIAAAQVMFGVGAAGTDGSSNLYVIASYATGPVAIDIGEIGFSVLDIAVDPVSAKLYVVNGGGADQRLYTVNPATATPTLIGSLGVGQNVRNALEFDVHGTLYGWGIDANLHTIKKSNGAATLIGPVGYGAGGDLAFDLDGTLWGAGPNHLYRIDPLTGAGTLVGGFSTGSPPHVMFGLEIDASGQMYGFAGESLGNPIADAYAVDKVTGAATLIGPIANATALGLNGVALVTTCGFGKYGPAAPLGLQWTAGGAPSYTQGSLRSTGAQPFSGGLLLASLGQASVQAGSLLWLVDTSSGALLGVVPFAFDAAGELTLPLSTSQSTLPGIDFFMQVFAIGPPVMGSNGLRFRPCP